jgi:hypothetical protein
VIAPKKPGSYLIRTGAKPDKQPSKQDEPLPQTAEVRFSVAKG